MVIKSALSEVHLTRYARSSLRSATSAMCKYPARYRRSVLYKGHASLVHKDNVVHDHLHSYTYGDTAHCIRLSGLSSALRAEAIYTSLQRFMSRHDNFHCCSILRDLLKLAASL